MSEWQPIETAPKDGTQVDLWCCSGSDLRYGERYVDAEFLGGKWKYYSDCYEGWVTISYTPTHWMPLPSPPKVQA